MSALATVMTSGAAPSEPLAARAHMDAEPPPSAAPGQLLPTEHSAATKG